MPSSIRNATPVAVLHPSLSRVFARSQEYPVLENDYRNGESQRSVEISTSRRRWRLAKQLMPAHVAALRAFNEARNGPVKPFYSVGTRAARGRQPTRV